MKKFQKKKRSQELRNFCFDYKMKSKGKAGKEFNDQ